MRTQDMSGNNEQSTKIRQRTGVKQTAGVTFFGENGEWVAYIGPVRLTLNDSGYKCTVTDTRDGYFKGFGTVTAAKTFAKRRKHGRSIKEHMIAEKLKATQEMLKLSLEEMAKKISVSPRTLEAYYSGCRAIPVGLIENLCNEYTL